MQLVSQRLRDERKDDAGASQGDRSNRKADRDARLSCRVCRLCEDPSWMIEWV
jgi:hypothetical protein